MLLAAREGNERGLSAGDGLTRTNRAGGRGGARRPELGEEYRGIVESYQRDGWGIYDDSSDMDRAVVLSDGYYGDGSSVVWIYCETGKSVMIQNIDA